jgi:nitroreductase
VVVIEHTPYAISDGSRAIQSMILTAWAEGVGSNWVGFGSLPAMNELLDIPKELDALAIVPFGYPVKKSTQGVKKRKAASEVIHHGKFGQK